MMSSKSIFLLIAFSLFPSIKTTAAGELVWNNVYDKPRLAGQGEISLNLLAGGEDKNPYAFQYDVTFGQEAVFSFEVDTGPGFSQAHLGVGMAVINTNGRYMGFVLATSGLEDDELQVSNDSTSTKSTVGASGVRFFWATYSEMGNLHLRKLATNGSLYATFEAEGLIDMLSESYFKYYDVDFRYYEGKHLEQVSLMAQWDTSERPMAFRFGPSVKRTAEGELLFGAKVVAGAFNSEK